jgi:hypothetical protein
LKNCIEYVKPPGAGPAQGLYTNVTVVPPGPTAYIAGQLAAGDRLVKEDFLIEVEAVAYCVPDGGMRQAA